MAKKISLEFSTSLEEDKIINKYSINFTRWSVRDVCSLIIVANNITCAQKASYAIMAFLMQI